MKKIILEKENGIVTKKTYINEIEKKSKKQNNKHLCWESCEKAYASLDEFGNPICHKVYDRRKKKIDKYDFITDGYQIITEYGEVTSFLVYGCKKHQSAPCPKKLSLKETERLKNLKEEFRMAYYGVGSLEESYEIEKNNRKSYKLKK